MTKQEMEFDALDYILKTRLLPLNVRGGLMEILLQSWSSDGVIVVTIEELSTLMSCDIKEATFVIEKLRTKKIVGYEELENGVMKITCNDVKEKLELSEKRSKTGRRGADSKWNEKPELTLFENANEGLECICINGNAGIIKNGICVEILDENKPRETPSVPTVVDGAKFNPTSVPEFEEMKTLFGFNEIAHTNKTREIGEFISLLNHNNKLSHFSNQFRFYKKYKEESKEKKHSFKKFIEGDWDSENWEHKYKEFKNTVQQNGKQSRPQTTPIISSKWDPSKPRVPI